jgi:hypothetical protein
MSDSDNSSQVVVDIPIATPSVPVSPQGFLQELRGTLLRDPLSNLPSLFLLGVAVLGVFTLISAFFIDLLVFPFLLIAIFSSLFAVWHIRILGSMKVQIKRLTEQNNNFTDSNAAFMHENEVLNNSLTDMKTTIDDLKGNNDRLHQELTALQELRINLQSYADETKLEFSQLLQDVNQSFEHLDLITQANERVLLQRVAQDLEFLDHEVGMQRNEYERFVQRIPEHLQTSFAMLGDTSFEHVSGDDQRVDYQEIQALVHQVIKERVS